MKDIARMANVSRTTVSFVLNNRMDIKISEETRKKVLDIARKLDYYPHAIAKSLVKRQSKTLGLVWCQRLRSVFSDMLIPQVILGINNVALKKDYNILIQYIENKKSKDNYYHLARGKRIDGIILSGPRSDDEEILKLKEEDFPIVLIGQANEGDFSCSDIDNVEASKKIVNHLISHGHKRIAIITNAPLNYTASKLRLQGYKEALENAKINFNEDMVSIGNFTSGSGFQAVQNLLSLKEPPTAIFVASDVVAFGVMDAIKKKGLRIPEDIALAGFDNVHLSEHTDPSLTTVNVPAFDIGMNAANLLINIIEGEEEKNRKIILNANMIIRRSCGCKMNIKVK
ncbi:MAG: LacI family DNA-binding transcriptional regulator [Actinomycetota bacterium]|nr:LacI family DNA-binding transcriptional regulator [Actinomycetota bacterium]